MDKTIFSSNKMKPHAKLQMWKTGFVHNLAQIRLDHKKVRVKRGHLKF